MIIRGIKIKFYVGITLFVLLLLGGVLFGILSTVFHEGKVAAQETAFNLFYEMTSSVSGDLESLIHSTAQMVQNYAYEPYMAKKQESNGVHHPAYKPFLKALQINQALYSIFVGLEGGEFFQLIATRGNVSIIKTLKAPRNTHFVVRVISNDTSGRVQHWSYLDEKTTLLGFKEEHDFKFDPRDRLWYSKVSKIQKVVLSEPYQYNSSQELGLTLSSLLSSGHGVVGIDVTLHKLGDFLATKSVSKQGQILVFDSNNRYLAGYQKESVGKLNKPLSSLTDSSDDLYKNLMDLRRLGLFGEVEIRWIQDQPYLYYVVQTVLKHGNPLFVATISPLSDFTQAMDRMRHNVFLFSGLLLMVLVPLVISIAKKMARPLCDLSEDAQRIQKLDFSFDKPLFSFVFEVDQLSRAFSVMKSTIYKKTQALQETQKKLEKLIEIGMALSSERNHDVLLENILVGGKNLTHADAGTLYLYTKEKTLRFVMLHNDSLNIRLGGVGGGEITFSPIPLYDSDGEENHHFVVSCAALTAQTVNLVDAYNTDRFDFSGTKKFDQSMGYRSQSFLTVPLKTRQGEVIGVLQLINAQDPQTKKVIPFGGDVISMVEALAGQAAITLDNQTLMGAQKKLFNAFVKVIASAIDTKSPYTGGHCERVPKLSQMLAKAACDSKTEPFSDFTMDEEEADAVRLSAWLHDCGKVTTPEFVVDKATKLETINNRIHEVRMRFEVLRRDAEIAYWKGVSEGREVSVLKKTLHEEIEILEDDFAFVAESNVGGEWMAPERKERIHTIAEKKWLRYFDDQLGLSLAELRRRETLDKTHLPMEEPLLSDRVYHRIPRPVAMDPMIYAKHGILLDVPEYLYNRGEIYNLCIERGTLTNEERFKINEHVIQSIIMLDALPFPKTLEKVPDFAGAHHETMIGNGYPRQLKKEDMSIQARIIAIADIFEALTASDRPYKKAKTLSEAIKIMNFMKKDGHIDPDLFKLFLVSGVYREYADSNLFPSQVDDVDLSQYV